MVGAALKLLVIDDDEDARLAIGDILRRAGHSVRVEESVAGARAALAGELGRPDAILCDLMMPGEGAGDLYATVRANRDLVGAAFIVVTGARGEILSRAHTAMPACDGWLLKPLETCEPLTLIATAVEIARLRAGRSA